MKTCAFCGEPMADAAAMCRVCGRAQPGAVVSSPVEPMPRTTRRAGLFGLLAVIVFALLTAGSCVLRLMWEETTPTIRP